MTATAIDVQEATSTGDCKRPNCPRESRATRGRYAYLCDFHIDELRQQERRQSGIFGMGIGGRDDEADDHRGVLDGGLGGDAARSAPEPPTRRPGGTDGASLVQTVKALEKPARRLEAALTRRRAAKSEAAAAVAEFNEALRAIRELAAALLQA